MRPIEFIAALVGGTLIATLLVSIWSLHVPQPEKPIVEYKDFVAIVLTAATVVLAVLAIGLAILAVWGIREFENRARESAGKVAQIAIDAYLVGTPFAEFVRSRVDETVKIEVLATIATPTTQMASPDATSSTPIRRAPT